MTNTLNPGKQRLSRYHADIRTRQIRMGAHTAKDLRGKAGRSIPIRVGDTVKILRGDYKGKTGNVTMVDARRERVYIQGINRKKADGKEAFIAFRPSKLLITSMESKDKTRLPARAKTKEKANATINENMNAKTNATMNSTINANTRANPAKPAASAKAE